MIPGRENAAHLSQNSGTVTERLRSFMRAHRLSLEDLAVLLRTDAQTLNDWFREDMPPPGCLLALMVLLETAPQSGFVRREEEARLGPEESLRRVRAI